MYTWAQKPARYARRSYSAARGRGLETSALRWTRVFHWDEARRPLSSLNLTLSEQTLTNLCVIVTIFKWWKRTKSSWLLTLALFQNKWLNFIVKGKCCSSSQAAFALAENIYWFILALCLFLLPRLKWLTTDVFDRVSKESPIAPSQ